MNCQLIDMDADNKSLDWALKALDQESRSSLVPKHIMFSRCSKTSDIILDWKRIDVTGGQ